MLLRVEILKLMKICGEYVQIEVQIFLVFATHFTNLYQPLSNFPDSDFHHRTQERPVMQDPMGQKLWIWITEYLP